MVTLGYGSDSEFEIIAWFLSEEISVILCISFTVVAGS